MNKVTCPNCDGVGMTRAVFADKYSKPDRVCVVCKQSGVVDDSASRHHKMMSDLRLVRPVKIKGEPILDTTGPDQKPPVGGMGGSIHDWERGLDPWHRDAFPEEFQDSAPSQCERKAGWAGLDSYGNMICFVPDGTKLTPPSNS